MPNSHASKQCVATIFLTKSWLGNKEVVDQLVWGGINVSVIWGRFISSWRHDENKSSLVYSRR